jgi:hypothetical protein
MARIAPRQTAWMRTAGAARSAPSTSCRNRSLSAFQWASCDSALRQYANSGGGLRPRAPTLFHDQNRCDIGESQSNHVRLPPLPSNLLCPAHRRGTREHSSQNGTFCVGDAGGRSSGFIPQNTNRNGVICAPDAHASEAAHHRHHLLGRVAELTLLRERGLSGPFPSSISCRDKNRRDI